MIIQPWSTVLISAKCHCRGVMQLLPYITVNEMEKLAESNHHLSEQLPRYLSDMVSHECRIIGF